jgi:hypothetical protein
MPDDRVTREVFWNISLPGELAFYVLALVSLGLFGYGVSRQLKKVLRGKPTALPWETIRASLVNSVSEILSNRTVVRRHRLAGLMHLLIMWGFITLFIGTIIVSIEYDLFQSYQTASWLLGRTSSSLRARPGHDGALFLIGLLVALLRRYALKRPQLTWKPIDLLLPVWLLIGLTALWWKACVWQRARLNSDTRLTGLPLAFFFSKGGRVDPQIIRAWHWYGWWFHGALALGMGRCASVHAQGDAHFDSWVNILLRDLRPRKLAAVDVGRRSRITPRWDWNRGGPDAKDLLDLDSCTEWSV